MIRLVFPTEKYPNNASRFINHTSAGRSSHKFSLHEPLCSPRKTSLNFRSAACAKSLATGVDLAEVAGGDETDVVCLGAAATGDDGTTVAGAAFASLEVLALELAAAAAEVLAAGAAASLDVLARGEVDMARAILCVQCEPVSLGRPQVFPSNYPSRWLGCIAFKLRLATKRPDRYEGHRYYFTEAA